MVSIYNFGLKKNHYILIYNYKLHIWHFINIFFQIGKMSSFVKYVLSSDWFINVFYLYNVYYSTVSTFVQLTNM
jgi:hypothetical protein